MGGTFDPPHIGHLAMAEEVLSAMDLEEVWFLPTGRIAYKDSQNLSLPRERLAMVRLAVAGHPRFKVNGMEAEREEVSYTYQTLQRLEREFPDTEFVFIVGADSLDYMERWREPSEIFRRCVVAAVNRQGFSKEQREEKRRFLEKTFGAEIQMISMPPIDISSTELRKRAARGQSLHPFVPEAVCDYIKEHGLYQSGKERGQRE